MFSLSVLHLIPSYLGAGALRFSCPFFLAGRTCLSMLDDWFSYLSRLLGFGAFGAAPHLSDACVLFLSTTCERHIPTMIERWWFIFPT